MMMRQIYQKHNHLQYQKDNQDSIELNYGVLKVEEALMHLETILVEEKELILLELFI